MVDVHGDRLSARALEKQDLVILILVTVVLFRLRHVVKSWNRRLPPGPPSLPLIGNLHQLSKYMHRDFERLGKQYGPLMHLKVGSIPVIVVQNAAYGREFTKTHDQDFAYRPQDVTAAKYMGFDGQSIGFAPVGDQWRYMRSCMMTEVLSPKRMRVFKDQRQNLLHGAAKEIFAESKEGSPVNLRPHLVSLMYNIVSQMISGKTLYGTASAHSGEQEQFRVMIRNFIDMANQFVIKDWFPVTRFLGDFQGAEGRMRNAAQAMDQFLGSCLDDHRNFKEEANGDFIDTLLESEGTTNVPFTDSLRRRILQAFFTGGTDTSSSTVEWALAELLRKPSLMKRVQDEIDAVIGRNRPLAEAELSEMKLLNAVIQETFRLHPVGPFLIPRQGLTNRKVGDYDIPSNARIFISLWSIGRDESSWENPQEYIPERFLDSQRLSNYSGTDPAFIPFGSGRRQCPGKNLGMLLVPLVLASLLYLCDLSLPHGQTEVDLAEGVGLSLKMEKPLEVLASPRLAPDYYEKFMDGV